MSGHVLTRNYLTGNALEGQIKGIRKRRRTTIIDDIEEKGMKTDVPNRTKWMRVFSS